jgi:hypothetical protein
MQSGDAKIAEKACICFERLVESFQSSSERLLILSSGGLIPNMLAVMTARPRLIPPAAFTLCAHTLARLAAKCPALAQTLHDNNAPNVCGCKMNKVFNAHKPHITTVFVG